MGPLLALLLQVAPVNVIAVRIDADSGQQHLVLEADGEWGPVAVRREGGQVVAVLSARAATGLKTPALVAPLQAIELLEKAGQLEMRVTVDPDVPFEVQRKDRQLILVFGGRDPALIAEGITPQLLELYRNMAPPRNPALQGLGDPTTTNLESPESTMPGFGIGPLRFQPSLTIGYARTDTTIESPQPVADSFVQVEPRLGSQLILLDGRLRASYEPQIRLRSQFAKINRPSHELNVALEVPFASRFILRGSDHLSISTLDAIEVDRGREYFFDLGRFTRNEVTGSLHMEVGPRLNFLVGGSANRVRFSEPSGFFDYDQQRASAGFEFLLTESSHTRIGYGYERTPPALERATVETTAHSVQFSLGGELLPLMSTDFSVGYRQQDSPRAASGGQDFQGVTFSGTLGKDFTRRTRLSVSGGREILISSFEQNAFYISNSISSGLAMNLFLGLSGRVGGGYHWNSYRTVANGLGEPREDRLYGWTAGVSRTLNRWTYLRFDYGWNRRDSNVDVLDSQSTMMLIQLGISPFDSSSTSTTQ